MDDLIADLKAVDAAFADPSFPAQSIATVIFNELASHTDRYRYLAPWCDRVAAEVPAGSARQSLQSIAKGTFGIDKLQFTRHMAVADFKLRYPDLFHDLEQHKPGLTTAEAMAAIRPLAEAMNRAAKHPDVPSQLRRTFVAGLHEYLAHWLRQHWKRPADGSHSWDEVIDKARADVPAEASTSLLRPEPEPWPDPVDGAALLDAIRAEFTRYVVLGSNAAADTLALYMLLTHCYDCFDVLPNLLLVSPVKRCGKTKVLEVAQGVARRPLAAANASAASIYRTVDAWHPTLLLDECDSFLSGKRAMPAHEELRNIINSGHTRATAWVLRISDSGDQLEPKGFSTYCPKVLCFIQDRADTVPDTIEDRSITLHMRRRLPGEHVERWRHRYLAAMEPLYRQAVRWAADHAQALRDTDPEDVPHELNDRAMDCWRPLLSIADQVGGPWPARARAAAREMSREPAPEATPAGLQLLADLRGVFASGAESLRTEEVLRRLHSIPEAPWTDWRRGRPLTDQGLASLLRPFGVSSRNLRLGDRVLKGYALVDLAEPFQRYLPQNVQTSRYAATPPSKDNTSDQMQDIREVAIPGAGFDDPLHANNGMHVQNGPCSGVATEKSVLGDVAAKPARRAMSKRQPLQPARAPQADEGGPTPPAATPA